MVGLVIAFPGIVSSGLDKNVTYDLDKVRMEMEAAMPDPGAAEANDPMANMEGAEPADGAASEPDGAAPATTDDDPLKALQDSIADEPKKQ